MGVKGEKIVGPWFRWLRWVEIKPTEYWVCPLVRRRATPPSSGPSFLSSPLLAAEVPLVYDYLLSIKNEYFVKLTYIPIEDLCQMFKKKIIKLES